METVRILHIVGAMNRGGAETLLMELYRHIDRTKVQFDFLIYNYSDKPGAYDEEIKRLGGKIYLAKRRFYRGPIAYCRELKHFFRSHPEYHIVHAHQYATSGYMLAMAKASGVPVTIAHSHIAFPITTFLRRCADKVGKLLLKRNADYFLGCSDDALIALAGVKSDNKKYFLMKNAIDSKKFTFSNTQREVWRKEIGADDKTFIIGNVARFTYQKNHEQILRVFAEVTKDMENSLLVLIGTGSREEEMRSLAEELNIQNQVLFLGSKGNVHEIINAFDLFLMPSRYEGLGIVLIEAQANGLPCVMTRKFIPDEADIGAGLVSRVDLDASPEEWAKVCMNARGRIASEVAEKSIIKSGYEISEVASWLQEFYLEHWK